MIKRNTGHPDADNNVINLDDRLQKLEANALLRGRFIAGVSLLNAIATPIRHHLGRLPLGFLDAGKTGAVAAGYLNVTSADADFITLTATGFGATIVQSLWVF